MIMICTDVTMVFSIQTLQSCSGSVFFIEHLWLSTTLAL